MHVPPHKVSVFWPHSQVGYSACEMVCTSTAPLHMQTRACFCYSLAFHWWFILSGMGYHLHLCSWSTCTLEVKRVLVITRLSVLFITIYVQHHAHTCTYSTYMYVHTFVRGDCTRENSGILGGQIICWKFLWWSLRSRAQLCIQDVLRVGLGLKRWMVGDNVPPHIKYM